jgi:hypothetical protein
MNALANIKLDAERKQREIVLKNALDYYLPGNSGVCSPENCERMLRRIVFANWLQGYIDGKPFEPLLCIG